MKIIGIILATIGANLIEMRSFNNINETHVIFCTFLILIQCFGMANIIVIQSSLVMKYGSALLTFTYYSIGTAITLFFCLVHSSEFTTADLFFNYNYMPWLALLYASIFGTVYTYNAYAWAGKYVTPSICTSYTTLQPLITILLSYFCFHELIDFIQICGGLFIGLGLLLTIRSNAIGALGAGAVVMAGANSNDRYDSSSCDDFTTLVLEEI